MPCGARARRIKAIGFATIACAVFASSLDAADPLQRSLRKRHAQVRNRVFSVALQPFTFVENTRRAPVGVRVAYQVPTDVRRGERVSEYAYFIPRRLPRYNPPLGAEEYSYEAEDESPEIDRFEEDNLAVDLPDEVEEEEIEEAEPRFSDGRRPTVQGTRAVLQNGIAYAPAAAPARVKAAIWAANSLRGKPYRWGGGHGSFFDRGYDCSGTVSFALHHAGALASPLPSRSFLGYGERGRGRWITIYAREGHTFAVIAGLRLDTTDFRGGREGPRWHSDLRSTYGYVARHPAGL